jgi:Tfp pilus assembly protein PilF
MEMAMKQVGIAQNYERAGTRSLVWLAAYFSDTAPARAIQYYKDAIAMEPHHLQLYLKLGALLCQQQDPLAGYYLKRYDNAIAKDTVTTCDTLSNSPQQLSTLGNGHYPVDKDQQ